MLIVEATIVVLELFGGKNMNTRAGAIQAVSMVLLFAAAEGGAADRIEFSGRFSAMSKSQVLQLGQDHIYVTVLSESTGYFIDPPHDKTPMQRAAGPCRGTVEIKSGVAKGDGYCVRINPQGGKWLLSWKVNPDTSKGVSGTWEILGTEGNTVGWKGAGTWDPSVETGEGKFNETFSGWLEKP